jgi:hypothetical protein
MITGHFVFNPNASSKKLLKKRSTPLGDNSPALSRENLGTAVKIRVEK